MEQLQRVMWHEGMFLTPNQFQQWDRVSDWSLRFCLSVAEPLAAGFVRLEIDQTVLGQGLIALTAAAGILGDGTPFAFPEADAAPPSRAFAERFGAGRDRLVVRVALPAVRTGAPTMPDPDRPAPEPLRFRRQEVAIKDAVQGGAERDISVAVKELRLIFDDEPRDGLVTLPVCVLVRTSSGTVVCEESFVPPCTAIGASSTLLALLKRTYDIACARMQELSGIRRNRGQGLVEFSASETGSLLQLFALNSAIPSLAHLLAHPASHPRLLYLELARLAGQLSTVAAIGSAKDVPPYQHLDLTTTFVALEARLRDLLQTQVVLRYVPLPMARGAGGIHVARLPEAVLEGHRFIIALQTSAAQDKVAAQTSSKAKCASQGRVPQLIAQSIKGLSLAYLPVPPSEVPPQAGTSYFEVARAGDEWPAVLETRTFAVHLPPDYTELRIELMAVKE
jgi:type VI secretion system protein ImpJ